MAGKRFSVFRRTVFFLVMAIMISPVISSTAWAERTVAEEYIYEGNKKYFDRDFAGAEAEFSKAVQEEPDWAIAYNNRGLARLKQNKTMGAIDDFTFAIELDDSYVAPFLNRAKGYATQKEWAKARADINAGLAISPDNPKLLYNLGWIEDELENHTVALGHYEAALAADSDHLKAKLGAAISHARTGQEKDAIDGFYDVINSAKSGDFIASLAAYNLQLLRGKGISFEHSQDAADYEEAIFYFSSERYPDAVTALESLAFAAPMVADIPWILYWSYFKLGKDENAISALNEARRLMKAVSVDSLLDSAEIRIDGIRVGETPSLVYLFESRFDLTIRKSADGQNREWSGPVYADGKPGGLDEIVIDPETVTDFSLFAPVTDTDTDWLGDDWENRWYGNLSNPPDGDQTDTDGVINLKEYHYVTDPTASDTDGDGFSDMTEITAGTDPTGAGETYYVNDASTAGDIYCSASGDAGNDGLSPGSPKANLQSILDDYDVNPGDTILVDTGTYVLNADIVVSADDGGSGGIPVVIRGASAFGGTVMNRNSSEAGVYALFVDAANYVLIDSITFTGAPAGTGVGFNNAAGSVVKRCAAYGNGTGIAYPSRASHNLVYENDWGIRGNEYSRVSNNTLYNNRRAGLFAYGGTWKNNIVYTNEAGSVCFHLQRPGTKIVSDYNDYYAADSADTARYQLYDDPPVVYSTLDEWRAQQSQDLHSVVADPLFANVSAFDFHLKSAQGRYTAGGWTTDSVTSPCIDRADGSAIYQNEPEPNGDRANLGCFGGTGEASKTPAGSRLILLTPNGREILSGTVPIEWIAAGSGWNDSDTVFLEYSTDNGATWAAMVTDIPYFRGVYRWDSHDASYSGPFVLIRISKTGDTDISDTGDNWSYINNGGVEYFVNDGSTSYDVWCSAAGQDGDGRGASPETPAASVQWLLETYDLEPGDRVRIDTGDYVLTDRIVVGSEDKGSETGTVTFEGSPYGVVFDRQNVNETAAWYFYYGDYTTLTTAASDKYPGVKKQWMKITGAYKGIAVRFSNYCTFSRLELTGNIYGAGSYVGYKTRYHNLLVHDNTNGINLYHSKENRITNSTFANTGRHVDLVHYSDNLVLRNNIFRGDDSSEMAVYISSSNINDSDYNIYDMTGGAYIGRGISTLLAWQAANGQDPHSYFGFSADFADPAGGNYHLKSVGGRYEDGVWAVDSVSSPALDAGDPEADFTFETSPNGGRINLGAYGGTELGSRTPAERLITVTNPLSGEVLEGEAEIRWLAQGVGWNAGDTVRIEYSVDHGDTWNSVAGSVLADNGTGEMVWTWDTTTFPSSPVYQLRVTSLEDPGVSSLCNSFFIVRNEPLIFYVNDADTTNDVWCSAKGNDLNDGALASTPAVSVNKIVDNYDLEPGDIVRIDTGEYLTDDTILISQYDAGSGSESMLTFEASPYGVTINRQDAGSDVIRIEGDYVRIVTGESDKYSATGQRFMKITGGRYGVSIREKLTYCEIKRLELTGNVDGIRAGKAYSTTTATHLFQNNLVHNNTQFGIHIASIHEPVQIVNNTIAGNGENQIDILFCPSVYIRNNIIVADGSGSVVKGVADTMQSDYNLLRAVNGASFFVNPDYSDLASLQSGLGLDQNSLSENPLFVDSVAGDYHVKSSNGSYHGGAWTADFEISPCIDRGNPTDSVENEPEPNFGRVNLGAYGNTEQASKSIVDIVYDPYTTVDFQTLTGTKTSGVTISAIVDTTATIGPVTYPGATTWQFTVSGLEETINRITVTADNGSGYQVKTIASLTYDATAPEVTINPVESPTYQNEITVTGTRESGLEVSLSFDTSAKAGDPEYLSDTTWEAKASGFSGGVNRLTATVVDLAGNSKKASLDIDFIDSSPVALDEGLIADGLVAWYPFDGDAMDESGNGYHGTVHGPLPSVDAAGNHQSALSFDGVDDYVELPDLGLNGSITLSFWVRFSRNGYWERIVDFANGAPDDNILLARSATSGDLAFEVFDNNDKYGRCTAEDVIENGRWDHFTAIWTDGRQSIYKNGELVVQTDFSGAVPDVVRSFYYVGRSQWSQDAYFGGEMDEMRIYGRALSSYEIPFFNRKIRCNHFVTDKGIPVTDQLCAYDLNGDQLDFSIVTRAGKGDVVIDDPKTGVFTYTPDPNYIGTDTFSFKASDGRNESETVTVRVEVYGDCSGGDIDKSGNVNLMDAVVGLQVVNGLYSGDICLTADINQDGNIGISDVIFVLLREAGL